MGWDGMGTGWTVSTDAAPKLHVCEHEWSWELWDGTGRDGMGWDRWDGQFLLILPQTHLL